MTPTFNLVNCVALFSVLLLSYLVLHRMFRSGHDSREPPLAPQSIPVIGHLIGLSRSKFNYYVNVR